MKKPRMSWQQEHQERQGRLITAINKYLITEDDAELFDMMDNTIRQDWIRSIHSIDVSVN